MSTPEPIATRFLDTTPEADRFCEQCRQIYRENHLWWSLEGSEGPSCDKKVCARELYRVAEKSEENLPLFEALINSPPEKRRVAPPEPQHAPPVVRVVERRHREARPDLSVKRERLSQ